MYLASNFVHERGSVLVQLSIHIPPVSFKLTVPAGALSLSSLDSLESNQSLTVKFHLLIARVRVKADMDCQHSIGIIGNASSTNATTRCFFQ